MVRVSVHTWFVCLSCLEAGSGFRLYPVLNLVWVCVHTWFGSYLKCQFISGLKDFSGIVPETDLGICLESGLGLSSYLVRKWSVPGLVSGLGPGSWPAPASPGSHSSSALQEQTGLCCSSAGAL